MTAVPDTTSDTPTGSCVSGPDCAPERESSGPNLATLARLRGGGRNPLLLPTSRRARRS